MRTGSPYAYGSRKVPIRVWAANTRMGLPIHIWAKYSYGTENYHYLFYLFTTKRRKAVCPSVCLSAFLLSCSNSVSSKWIDSGLCLCDSYGLWHEQVCFYKFLRLVCWAQQCLKDAAVIHFKFHFGSRKYAKLCNFAPT